MNLKKLFGLVSADAKIHGAAMHSAVGEAVGEAVPVQTPTDYDKLWEKLADNIKNNPSDWVLDLYRPSFQTPVKNNYTFTHKDFKVSVVFGECKNTGFFYITPFPRVTLNNTTEQHLGLVVKIYLADPQEAKEKKEEQDKIDADYAKARAYFNLN